jgi:hypothetical protein
MKTLHIPTIGDEVTLAAPWKFTVHREYRNMSLIEWMGESRPGDQLPCTLPKGTKLRIDRIYIRRNLKEFDSVTFFLKDAKTVGRTEQRVARQMSLKPGSLPFGLNGVDKYDVKEIPYTQKIPARPVRFWAKLADVNRMKIK